MRRIAWLVLLAGVGCSRHPPTTRADSVDHPALQPIPAGMRIVHLARAGDDTSCLRRGGGGTLVSEDLSDAEVREVEASIRKTSKLPIISIRHPPPENVLPNQSGTLLDVVTGGECGGALSGHGSEFRFRRVDGAWQLIDQGGDWQG